MKGNKTRKAKFLVGQRVWWRGQERKLFNAPIRRITEPQPGNYVLWLEIHEGRFKDDLFPINHQDVQLRPLTKRERGPNG